VAELFEARRPKDAAEMARIDGVVSFEGTVRGKRKLVVKNEETQQEEEHLIATGRHIIVQPGDVVHKGQHLTEGAADPHEILEILGPSALYDFLISQVQEVYRLQGVTINDKHIEIIIRQMLRKVKITEPGDTSFLWGEQIDRLMFEEENRQVEAKGGKPAEATPVLLGGPRFQMMAPAVYDQFSRASNWPFGAALAFILLVVTLLMTVIGSMALGRKYRTA